MSSTRLLFCAYQNFHGKFYIKMIAKVGFASRKVLTLTTLTSGSDFFFGT